MKNLQSRQRGFTLIELLVIVLLFGLLGAVSSNSLFGLLKGASRAENIKEVKQSGDYIVSLLQQKIRFAQSITSTCDGSNVSTLTVLNRDSTTTTFVCNAGEIVMNDGTATTLTSSLVSVTTPSCLVFSCTNELGLGSYRVSLNMTLAVTATANSTDPVSETYTTLVTIRKL